MSTTCTDCGEQIEDEQMAHHMLDEHGVQYALPPSVCPTCGGTLSCERIRGLIGAERQTS